jgi:hypothetical protein
MNLAPIGISTYIRLEHLKQTISALQSNTLAKESKLYIFSDAAKPGDEEKVRRVRNYLHNIGGFKEVYIVERNTNNRVFNNRGGIKQLLDEYGRMIFMEEDIVTAPGFLKFMNDGLVYYKNNDKVGFIGGHTHNLKENLNGNDVHFTRRFNGWGFGIWKKNFFMLEKQVPLEELVGNIKIKNALDEYGADLYDMALLDAKGSINAADVRACFQMVIHNLYMVLPTETLVKNIGLDGTGNHCGNEDRYMGDELSKKTSFNFSSYYHDDETHYKFKALYDKPIITVRIINKLARIFFGRNLIKLRSL